MSYDPTTVASIKFPCQISLPKIPSMAARVVTVAACSDDGILRLRTVRLRLGSRSESQFRRVCATVNSDDSANPHAILS
jgi:hypothetical protein